MQNHIIRNGITILATKKQKNMQRKELLGKEQVEHMMLQEEMVGYQIIHGFQIFLHQMPKLIAFIVIISKNRTQYMSEGH